MKKFLLAFFLVSILLLFSVSIFAAAGEKSFENVFINLSTSQPGGGWYPFGGSIATICEKYIPGLTVTVQSSAGLAENLALLEQKKAEVVFSNPDMSYLKYRGIGNFEGKAYKDMRTLFNITGAPYYIVALQNSPIKTPLDLRGKKIAMAPVGNSLNLAAAALFDAYGLKEEDMKFFRGARMDKADALKDGRVDAGIFIMNLGSAVMMDLITANHCKIIPVTGEYREKLVEKYPYYMAYTIPKEVYGLSKDVDSYGLSSFLACDASLDEDLAYILTKTYFEHLDEIGEMYPPAKDLTLEGGARSIAIPLHPGSEKYFKEMGVIK